jgi:hypothetical protein
MLPDWGCEKGAELLRRIAVLALVFAFGDLAYGQTPAPDAVLQAELSRLALASDDLEHHLPSFACKEILLSQELRGGKVKKEVRAAGDLRVVRDADGKLNERFEATEQNGHPIRPDQLRLPMFVAGGFSNALDFLQTSQQACYRFTLAGDRLDYESDPLSTTPGCAKHSETHGYTLLRDNGDISHVELRVPEDLARQRNSVPLGLLDLSRIELGGRSFLLSTHVVAEIPRNKSTYHWEATYSQCRLFSVDVKIGPSTLADPDRLDSGADPGLRNP